MFTIKQKNPEYFGPEVRGKIIFQKFQSKTKDLCFEVFLLSLGLEKNERHFNLSSPFLINKGGHIAS